MPADRRQDLLFRAMGSAIHVVVVGGTPRALQAARERIDDLERRWSRFNPHSEIARINAGAGGDVVVSRDTSELVRRSLEAYETTDGYFDPTVLGAVIRAGYDRTFEALPPGAGDGRSELRTGAAEIEVDLVRSSVRLPRGVGFDPGGIGKGSASDIVAEELLSLGVDGVCINIGGDIRVEGAAPNGGSWFISIEPDGVGSGEVLALRSGSVATSSRLRRAWGPIGDRRHHLIDPISGVPVVGDVVEVTVVAAEGWQADVATKAVFAGGIVGGFDLLERLGVEGVATTEDARRHQTRGFHRFVVADAVTA